MVVTRGSRAGHQRCDPHMPPGLRKHSNVTHMCPYAPYQRGYSLLRRAVLVPLSRAHRGRATHTAPGGPALPAPAPALPLGGVCPHRHREVAHMRDSGPRTTTRTTPAPASSSRLVHVRDPHLLRATRQASGLSQTALAGHAHVRREAVSHWETGRVTSRTYGRAWLVATALGAPLSFLFTAQDGGRLDDRPPAAAGRRRIAGVA